MSSACASGANIPLEDSIPEAGASLESILCTEELQRRPPRPPDYEKENRALVALISALADSPNTIFQTLAETILDITQCDSAGLSLLTKDGKTPDVYGKRFYWPAICGMWSPHVGGGTPRNFGPCGDVLDQNRTLLFRHFERRYPYLIPVIPTAEECLLVPFYVAGQAVGTIWAIMHSDRRKFDGEDDRVMASLGKFASSAYQALIRIEDLKFQEERERLRQAQAELAHLNRVSTMGELTASLAHEINQPIGAAVTNAQACLRFLNRDQPDVPVAREAALEMVRDATRAADIIDRVRSLYRKGSLKLEMVDVNEVIGEMVVMLHDEANRSSVRMHAELSANIPDVLVDRVQLQQVLMNLMINGIEAMRGSGGELSIKSHLAEDGQLMISVSDMGVGLPAGKADEIFNAFFTTKPQGTGLGLAITRSIVESHGGRVWATANTPRGATFQFTLPAKKAAHA